MVSLNTKIILPLDLEKQTKEKVTYALEYARYWDATIRIVSVILRDNQEVRDKLTRNIKQVEKFIKDAGVRCTAELIQGEKKQTLGDFVFEYENALAMKTFFVQLMLERGFLASTIFYSMFAHQTHHVEQYLKAVAESFQIIKESECNGSLEKQLQGNVASSGFKRLT